MTAPNRHTVKKTALFEAFCAESTGTLRATRANRTEVREEDTDDWGDSLSRDCKEDKG